MSTTVTSTNMLLPVPVVGSDLGPQYAIDINSCMALIDSHNHSTGSGVQITQAGISITGDFAFNGFNATLLKSSRYSAQGAVLSGASDLGCVYVVSNDMYFNDGLGNQIRMTQSGGVAGTPGSIAGLVAPASATYIPASTKFVWQSNTNVSADLDAGSIIIRQNTASANGITISSPSSLASAYALTLFPSLPSTKRPVSVDSSGNITSDIYAAPYDAQNYTLTATVASNALTIALKTLAGTDPSATDTVKLGFRSATATSGSFSSRTVSAATSLVVPSGTTIGCQSGITTILYVYAMDNGGTVVLATSLTLFDETVVQSSSAISGGSSTSTLYSTAAQTSLPIRFLGQITISEATAGTWASSPTLVILGPNKRSISFNGVLNSSPLTISTNNSSQTIALVASGGTPANIAYDSNGVWNSSTNTYTTIAAGKWFLQACVFVGSTNVLANDYYINFNIGGTDYESDLKRPVVSTPFVLSQNRIFNLAAGVAIKLNITGLGNNSVNTVSAFNETFFGITYLGP
jgi:hypothetical protein